MNAMKAQKVEASETYVLRLETGVDALKQLEGFCLQKQIRSGSVELIGAVSSARLGYYDQADRVYSDFVVEGDLEIISFLGNISLKDGAPFVHAHVCLGRGDGSTVAGHGFELTVFAAEARLTAYGGEVTRSFDEETGLTLMDLADV